MPQSRAWGCRVTSLDTPPPPFEKFKFQIPKQFLVPPLPGKLKYPRAPSHFSEKNFDLRMKYILTIHLIIWSKEVVREKF